MITHIEVDNFKALNNFSMDFTPLTVIVGNNATGKSTVLQVLDFVTNCVKEDFAIIIERRGWKVANVKSKFAGPNANRISISLDVEVKNEDKKIEKLQWKMVLQTNMQKNTLHLVEESVKSLDDDEYILLYKTVSGGMFIDRNRNEIIIPANMVVSHSFLKLVSGGLKSDDRLFSLKKSMEKSASFELLSPKEMRLSSRGVASDIGMSGKDLPSFIKHLNEQQKTRFMEKLGVILKDRISDVRTSTLGKPGWTQINVLERYQNAEKEVEISSKELSDGILRVLAFVAISEIEPSDSVLLLDEIENGINADYAENLLQVLSNIYEESGHQLILTTHSTVFLDYVKPENIVFLARSFDGNTVARKLAEMDVLTKKLDYMYPGEIVLNVSQAEIADYILSEKGELNG